MIVKQFVRFMLGIEIFEKFRASVVIHELSSVAFCKGVDEQRLTEQSDLLSAQLSRRICCNSDLACCKSETRSATRKGHRSR